MPIRAKKQIPKLRLPSAEKNSSFADLIRSVADEDVMFGFKVNVYGETKTGKTRFASSFPKPMLMLETEKGTKSVSNIKGLRAGRIRGSNDWNEAIEILETGEYKSVSLDTAGGFQSLLLKEILGLDELPISRNWGMATYEAWQACNAQFMEKLAKLFHLSETQGLNVIVIAHERVFNAEGKSSDVLNPSVNNALTPGTCHWLNAESDYIGQTFIREATEKKPIDPKNLKKGYRDVKTGEMEYCLRIGPNPIYKTGVRVPVGQKVPDSIVDPTYDKLALLVSGKLTDE